MAAKQVDISTDGGSNYHTLPGSTADFNEEVENITDTIFGQNWESTEAGTITWTVTSDAFWKGSPGYKCKLHKGGTSTAMGGPESTTQITGTDTYQIDDVNKRVFDPNQTLTIKDDGDSTDLVSTGNVESIDFLFGKVTLSSSYTLSGSVTIDGNFIPITQNSPSPDANAYTANSYSLTQSTEPIQTTTFPKAQANGGYHTHDVGLRTVSLSVEGIFDSSNNAKSDLRNRKLVIIEIDPVGDGKSIARGMFRPSTAGQSGDVGATEDESLEFTLNVIDEDATLNKTATPFSWSHASDTTLNTAVEKLLDAFINETKPKVKYLYDGTNGQKGDSVLTDISLSGGIGEMNTFSVEFQGDGAANAVP